MVNDRITSEMLTDINITENTFNLIDYFTTQKQII